jgi:hypothetical protein
MKESEHLKELGADGKIILKLFFKEWEGACSGLICLRIRTNDRML